MVVLRTAPLLRLPPYARLLLREILLRPLSLYRASQRTEPCTLRCLFRGVCLAQNSHRGAVACCLLASLACIMLPRGNLFAYASAIGMHQPASCALHAHSGLFRAPRTPSTSSASFCCIRPFVRFTLSRGFLRSPSARWLSPSVDLAVSLLGPSSLSLSLRSCLLGPLDLVFWCILSLYVYLNARARAG